MKAITKIIITLSIILSSLSTTFAEEEGYIEKLLDLNYWVEEYNINLSSIDYIHFTDYKYNRVYSELKRIDTILKRDFMDKYRSWEFWYYQINWIVTNYNNFIYHANKFLFFLKIKEQNNYFIETDSAIIKSYRDMISSYKKVKNLVKWY